MVEFSQASEAQPYGATNTLINPRTFGRFACFNPIDSFILGTQTVLSSDQLKDYDSELVMVNNLYDSELVLVNFE
jgi:hypothetical protein